MRAQNLRGHDGVGFRIEPGRGDCTRRDERHSVFENVLLLGDELGPLSENVVQHFPRYGLRNVPQTTRTKIVQRVLIFGEAGQL
jgi:hypothetical protein